MHLPLARFTCLLSIALGGLACGVAAQTDPAGQGNAKDDAASLQGFAGRVQMRLAKHPYFRQITLLPAKLSAPFVFLVQRPEKDDPEYVRRVVNPYLPFLNALRRSFEADYVTKLGWKPHTDNPKFAVAILNSRGSYNNYAQAVGASELHHARAHYDPRLQLAVSYVDTFAKGNKSPEARGAVLHEFVHALQHAYSGTAKMPQPTWYNEGLAEYRSTATHMASSLRDPSLDQNHLMRLVRLRSSPTLHNLVAPLPDLLAPISYADVIRRADRRLGGALEDPGDALGAFYAQSTAFVAFLHKAEDGRYRPIFDELAGAIQAGKRGRLALKGAMEQHGVESVAALDQAFQDFLTKQAETRLRIRFKNKKGRRTARPRGNPTTAKGQGKDSTAVAAAHFDAASELAFVEADSGSRIGGARALCARGEFELALELLPQDDQSPSASRVRQRATEAVRLRQGLFEYAKAKKKRLAPMVGSKRVGGTLVDFSETEVTLRDRKAGDRKLPLTAFTAKNLAIELKKHKRLRRGSALLAWLDWLGGKPAKSAVAKLDASDPLAADLRSDLNSAADPADGAAAAALAQLQQLTMPDDPAEARATFERLRGLLTRHGSHALWRARKDALRACAKALAFRSFSLAEPDCLGLAAKVETLGDGRIRVRYAGSGKTLNKDFEVAKALSDEMSEARPRLATSGRTLIPSAGYYLASGSGVFRWRLPATGPTVISTSLSITGPGFYGVMLCAEPTNGHIQVSVGGVATIFDRGSRLADSVGTSANLVYDRPAKIVIRHDGKKQLRVTVDGAQSAKLTDVAGRTRGLIGFDVHSSTPLAIHGIEIETTIDKSATPELRRRYVQRMLATIK